MMENKEIYGLLIGVENYEEMKLANLPSSRNDVFIFAAALLTGIEVPVDNIRIMCGNEGNGCVKAVDFAREIASFHTLLRGEDTFISYFSGHGTENHLLFSSERVKLQSVIDKIEQLLSKNKVLILDCCYSGKFKIAGAKHMAFESSMEEFSGHGIAIIASSAADEVSRFSSDGKSSLFTQALSVAIIENRKQCKVSFSLHRIYEETRKEMQF